MKLIKEAVKNTIRSGVASHVQTVGKGGLLITLARISAHYGLGLEAQLTFQMHNCLVKRKVDILLLLKKDRR